MITESVEAGLLCVGPRRKVIVNNLSQIENENHRFFDW